MIDNISISSLTISGSLNVSSSLTYGNISFQTMSNNIQGTSSYAITALTSSYVSSSNVLGVVNSSSFALNTSLLLSSVTTATSSADFMVPHYQSLGSQIKLKPIGEFAASNISTYNTLTSGWLHIAAVYVYEPIIVTGVMWWQQVQGVYTSNNYNGVALYSYDGSGTINLLVSSSNNGNMSKASSTTWASQSFSAPYTITSEGIYYIGYMYSTSAATTTPQIGASINQVTAAVVGPPKATNSACFFGYSNLSGALPSSRALSTFSGTTSNTRLHLFLY